MVSTPNGRLVIRLWFESCSGVTERNERPVLPRRAVDIQRRLFLTTRSHLITKFSRAMIPSEDEFEAACDSRLSEHEAWSQFVDDVVQFYFDHRESEDFPPLLFDNFFLSSEFATRLLDFLGSRTGVVRDLERMIARLMRECRSRGGWRETLASVSEFLRLYRCLLSNRDTTGLTCFLGVISKLCFEFYRKGRLDCIHLVKARAKQMIAECYPDCYRDIVKMGVEEFS